MHGFFPVARAGVDPGMCQTRPFYVILRWGKREEEVVRIGWRETLNGVAGSVAPMPKPWPNAYRIRLTEACAARRDLGWWFLAEPSEAYLAARLADSVVASARRQGELPFTLTCEPFPRGELSRPLCEQDVRRTVSDINPRAIMRVSNCTASKPRECMEIAVAKDPAGSEVDTNQWGLQITFVQNDHALEINQVDVSDTQLIIE
ncbi:hypothetical protein GCM10011494_20620 [Novosphingobium endophyticum]|uniref:Uncharacterized protein n=1 Tax=Novosphingobium endophyticum TaxID=1955250 RepID=A0A916TSR5_9SPHN|nr:hypothetical protein GCM10011494_20620 [Novosphingobium endophyticum]